MTKSLPNHKEFYIYGKPIQTKWGIAKPIMVSEIPELMQHYHGLTLSKPAIIKALVEYRMEYSQALRGEGAPPEYIKEQRAILGEIIDVIKEQSLLETIHQAKESMEVNQQYTMITHYYEALVNLFNLVFGKNIIDQLTTDNDLEEVLELIRDMNGIAHEPVNPNPEIERRNEIRRLLAKKKGDSVSYEAMITSVFVATGHDPFDLTFYQLQKVFDRIAKFKAHELTGIYRMMSDEVEVQSWFGDTQEQKEESYITDADLERARKGEVIEIEKER